MLVNPGFRYTEPRNMAALVVTQVPFIPHHFFFFFIRTTSWDSTFDNNIILSKDHHNKTLPVVVKIGREKNTNLIISILNLIKKSKFRKPEIWGEGDPSRPEASSHIAPVVVNQLFFF